MKLIWAISVLTFLEGTAAIWEGTPVNRNQFPFIVGLTSKVQATRDGHRWGNCFGTIVSPNIVITAAHCIPPASRTGHETGMTVEAHDLHWHDEDLIPEQQRTVKQILMPQPQSYIDGYPVNVNDLAILVLNHPFQFHEYLWPAQIPKPGQIVKEGQFLGYRSVNTLADTLKFSANDPGFRKVHALVFESPECSDGSICAIGLSGSLCKDDRSVPLICNADDQTYICGVSSSSVSSLPGLYNCDTSTDSPSIFTNVAKYSDWINAIIAQFNFTCPETHFNCGDRACVPRASQLDGKIDCPTGTDEAWRNLFKCKRAEKWVGAAYICDGKFDCGEDDVSDELGCARYQDQDVDRISGGFPLSG